MDKNAIIGPYRIETETGPTGVTMYRLWEHSSLQEGWNKLLGEYCKCENIGADCYVLWNEDHKKTIVRIVDHDSFPRVQMEPDVEDYFFLGNKLLFMCGDVWRVDDPNGSYFLGQRISTYSLFVQVQDDGSFVINYLSEQNDGKVAPERIVCKDAQILLKVLSEKVTEINTKNSK